MSYHVVAEVLGIEELQTNLDLIDLVRHGLSSRGISSLSNKLGISPGELSRFLRVSLNTLQRYKGKKLDINMSDRLLTDIQSAWMFSVRKRIPLLGSRAPYMP